MNRPPIIETYREGTVKIHGNPERRFEAPATLRFDLGKGSVAMHLVPNRLTRIEVSLPDQTHQLNVDTQTVGNSAINPELTVVDASTSTLIGHMWGPSRDVAVALAGEVLGEPLEFSRNPTMVSPLVVGHLRSILL